MINLWKMFTSTPFCLLKQSSVPEDLSYTNIVEALCKRLTHTLFEWGLRKAKKKESSWVSVLINRLFTEIREWLVERSRMAVSSIGCLKQGGLISWSSESHPCCVNIIICAGINCTVSVSGWWSKNLILGTLLNQGVLKLLRECERQGYPWLYRLTVIYCWALSGKRFNWLLEGFEFKSELSSQEWDLYLAVHYK